MFNAEKEENKLGDEKREIIHSFVMNAMFLTKRVCADVQLDIYFLDSRVREPRTQDWVKILRFLSDLT